MLQYVEINCRDFHCTHRRWIPKNVKFTMKNLIFQTFDFFNFDFFQFKCFQFRFFSIFSIKFFHILNCEILKRKFKNILWLMPRLNFRSRKKNSLNSAKKVAVFRHGLLYALWTYHLFDVVPLCGNIYTSFECLHLTLRSPYSAYFT